MNNNFNIPFVDLHLQYLSIQGTINDAISAVIKESAYIKGKYVDQFEKSFAKKYGIKNCIGVANGTDAIYIVLKCLGIGCGDEVITVANSWISTSETISQTGAIPIFVDIEKEFYTIDPKLIESKINEKTKAIIPVHLYGQPANIAAIKLIADQYGLMLIEDCAQSHFSKFGERFVGSFGIASTFSFYPGKNLGAYGDAGAILTDDDDLAEKVRMYANHGALKKHKHQIEGINSRLDGLQASILSAKLNHIDEWNARRLRNAQTYNELLKNGPGISTPLIRDGVTHTFHLYVIRSDRRDDLKTYLTMKGVETSIHYPTALPFLPAYGYLNHTHNEFPIASEYQNKILSLPMYPELTEDQIKFVVEQIKDFKKST